MTFAAGKTLKRSTLSGPTVGVSFTNDDSGIIAPVVERTYISLI